MYLWSQTILLSVLYTDTVGGVLLFPSEVNSSTYCLGLSTPLPFFQGVCSIHCLSPLLYLKFLIPYWVFSINILNMYKSLPFLRSFQVPLSPLVITLYLFPSFNSQIGWLVFFYIFVHADSLPDCPVTS